MKVFTGFCEFLQVFAGFYNFLKFSPVFLSCYRRWPALQVFAGFAIFRMFLLVFEFSQFFLGFASSYWFLSDFASFRRFGPVLDSVFRFC